MPTMWQRPQREERLPLLVPLALLLGVTALFVSPSDAACTFIGTELNCAYQSLTVVPANISASTTRLLLNNNLITIITNTNFLSLTNVNFLDLSNNRLAFLPSNVFLGMISLYELDIYLNQIVGIAPGAFNGLPSLASLSVSRNRITSLANSSFAGLSKLSSNYIFTVTTLHRLRGELLRV
eukprot:m.215467 g.215467  ORF g.215467 m.215467 type:complete len:181 (-) comp15590_c0_seq11:4493-5035(-)